MPDKPQKTDRMKSIGDYFKKKKEDKRFFLKVGIGVGVVLLLIIIIIVVAAVVPRGGGTDDNSTDGGGVASDSPINQQTSRPTTLPPPLEFVIPAYYMIQVAGSVTVMLAIDDVSQSYVIQADEVFRTIYYIVNFKERRQIYVGVQKEPNDARSDVLENTILFCVSRGLQSDFNGEFFDAADMRASGSTHVAEVQGTNITITSRASEGPLTLTGSIARIFNSSCGGLASGDTFQWKEAQTACEGNQTLQTDYGRCQGGRCPVFETDSLKSMNEVCEKFQRCNYIMGECDNFWTPQNPYKNLPYCNCRQRLAEDADQFTCPDAAIDSGGCETPRRRAEEVSNSAPCLCQYSVRRIHPYFTLTGGSQSRETRWRLDTLSVTGPSPSIRQCMCGQ